MPRAPSPPANNPEVVEIARALEIGTHRSMLPPWPMQRFGWARLDARNVAVIAQQSTI